MKERNRNQESIVYVAVNNVTGAKYIGVTCDYLSRRVSKHFWCAEKKNSQTHFHRAIRKYGRSAFKFSVIATFPKFDDALAEEIRLISELTPKYNMTKGGDGTKGFRLSPEQVAKGVAKRIGQKGYWKGKKLLPHVVEKIRENNKRPERIAQWSAFREMGPKSTQRAVVCLDDGMKFDSSRKAAEFYGISRAAIYSVCQKSKHKTAGGLVFRFMGEDNGGKEEAIAVRASVLANRQRTAAIARSAR